MAHLRNLALGGFLVAACCAPALAASEPATRLVECGSQSCLQVYGNRDDATAPVSINGHVVSTKGARKWRARVPVSTIRAWSAAHARTITVTVAQVSYDASLPVGMLAPSRDLAMLVVRVK